MRRRRRNTEEGSGRKTRKDGRKRERLVECEKDEAGNSVKSYI